MSTREKKILRLEDDKSEVLIDLKWLINKKGQKTASLA